MIENTVSAQTYIVADNPDFAFEVPFYNSSEIHCFLSVDGEERELTGTEFAVAPLQSQSDYSQGAAVTLLVPLVAGARLTIMRVIPLVQKVNLPLNGKLPSTSLEGALDKLTMMAQQLAEADTRSVKMPPTSAEDPEEFVPKVLAAAENARTAETAATAAAASATTASSAAATATAAAAEADRAEQAIQDDLNISLFELGADVKMSYVRDLRLFDLDVSNGTRYRVRIFINTTGSGGLFRFYIERVPAGSAAGSGTWYCGVNIAAKQSGQQWYSLKEMRADAAVLTKVVGEVLIAFPEDNFELSSGATTWIRPSVGILTEEETKYLMNDKPLRLLENNCFTTDAHDDFLCFRGIKLYGTKVDKYYKAGLLIQPPAESGDHEGEEYVRARIFEVDSPDASVTDDTPAVAQASFYAEPGEQVAFAVNEINSSHITGGGTMYVPEVSATIFHDTSPASLLPITLVGGDEAESSIAKTYLDSPFEGSVDDLTLRRIVKGIRIYAPDRLAGHHFYISALGVEELTDNQRFRIVLSDADAPSGEEIVATYALLVSPKEATVTAFAAAIPTTVKLTDAAVYVGDTSTHRPTGVYATVELDTGAITAYFARNFAADKGALLPSAVYLHSSLDDYPDSDLYHEAIDVAYDSDDSGQLRDAVESLYVNSTSSDCNRSSYHHRIRIRLSEGTFFATDLVIPPFVEIEGAGVGRTIILREDTSAKPCFQAPKESKILNCTIRSDSAQYAIHSDDANSYLGGASFRTRRLNQHFRNVDLVGGASQATWLFGCGVSWGERIRFDGVRGMHLFPGTGGVTERAASFGFHNTLGSQAVGSTNPLVPEHSFVEMHGCGSADASLRPVIISSTNPGHRCTLTLIDCDFDLIYYEDDSNYTDTSKPRAAYPEYARDKVTWDVRGNFAGPLLFDVSAPVLALPAGSTVGGTAAPLILGKLDAWGRGELYVADGTDKSLGKRLGDCSGTPKTLTVGSSTVTFSTDLTDASNTDVLAVINAVLGTGTAEIVDLGPELYPEIGTRLVKTASDGAAIPRGRFVKRTGFNTVAAAGSGDLVFGWTLNPIPASGAGTGRIVVGRRVAKQYLGVNLSSNGDFGITAGAVDFSAQNKVGTACGALLELW